ncbi:MULTISPECIES: site-specific integrase [Psychrilyobacter]|uniref:Site-specific integrase n=1 Tax=Psychrilyobacter piezotolerans TaxID=2293438 RepID=A0ABX9KIU1_9FUSO|nr:MULTISPECIES: site-specific integrase [Psychrilyobacter]MCS5420265.1 site-specific integrase [Psychrilyobacter sp. S5]NDI77290.1 site-specific integrase [Psychrilyobacter piezotolerans]RDE63344.1 site-specific integrase [Psychrilyobacter sp. S5]REI41886.1 site-specific integrase [Psychrilyobacter piezotolerans]
MSVYKDKLRNSWYVEVRYKSYNNEQKKKKKRGFKTKKDAKEWEIKFLSQEKETSSMLDFRQLAEIYLEDIQVRVKASTFARKKRVFSGKLVPYFKDKLIQDITPTAIKKWQNHELKNEYTKSYFKTLQKELSAIFNYAVKFYGVKENPVKVTGGVQESPLLRDKKDINIITPEIYKRFIREIKTFDNSEISLIFSLLYYSGCRIGEVLALNTKDLNFDDGSININKTYSKIDKKGYITTPKTKSSIRVIKVPDFLMDDLKWYIDTLYDKEVKRIFQVSRTNLHRRKNLTIKKLKLKQFSLHDFRHSHASILFQSGVNIVKISKRLGHESIKMTLDTYSHLVDTDENKVLEVLNKLNDI